MENQEKQGHRKFCVYARSEEEARKIQYLIKRYKKLAKGTLLDYDMIDKMMSYDPEAQDIAVTTADKILNELKSRTTAAEQPEYKEPQTWMTREQKYAIFAKKFPQMPAELLMELVDSWVSEEERRIMSLDLFQLIGYKNDIMKKCKFYDMRLFEVLQQLRGKEQSEVRTTKCF